MQEPRSYALAGGLDLVTPALRTPPGRVIAGLNYEAHARGYRRKDGHEVYDGQLAPSDTSYSILFFDASDTEIAADDVVTGAGGATGRAVLTGILESGTYGGSDAAGYVVLMSVSGTFVDDEALDVGGPQIATANGVATDRGATTDALDMTYLETAMELARADIAKVPGSGSVLGVWSCAAGITYAWRANAGATATVMHKSTTSGWSAVALGRELPFTSGGVTEIEEGQTITGATSAATAVVTRVVLTSGTWAGGDAAGKFIFASQTGTFQAENIDVGAAPNLATIAADSTAITLAVGARMSFRNFNFVGTSGCYRMYGVDQVNRGFEFDGTVYVPIDTGMTTDAPVRVAIHYRQLFFGFAGGSVQHSGPGNPYAWSVVLGAAEIGLGTEVTDFVDAADTVLAIFGRKKVAMLHGTDSTNWDLQTLTDEGGAVAYTAQRIGLPYYLDTIGVRSIKATQAFGNFRIGAVTDLVEPIFASKRKQAVTAIGSVRVKAKDSYLLFFSDNTVLQIYFGRKVPEIMLFDIGFTPSCVYAAEGTDLEEVLYAADADGWVYQLDAGYNHNGDAITAFLRLPFNHVGSPARDKRWHRAEVEIDASPNTNLSLTAEFGYADANQPASPAPSQDFTLAGSGGFWDEANWNEFYWSSPAEGLAEANIDGYGQNCSILAHSEETYAEPHIIHGITLNFSYRRLRR